jgi:hypothetical protein
MRRKSIFAVVFGVAAWVVVATVLNRLLRAGLAGYGEVEATMAFTQPMLWARLVLGAVASLAAGYVTAWLAGSSGRPAKALVATLLVIFVPMHAALWAKFPAWYHAVFLLSLVALPLVGARLRTPLADSRGR